MKKFLLITFIASMFAAGSAFAHCGACGTGDASHDKAAKTAECAEACKTKCCASKDKAACKDACSKKACCSKAKDKAADTAAAPAPSCCPGSKASKPA